MGGLTGLIGPAVGLGGKASNAIKGSGSGSGPSPQEAALAEYTKGQHILANDTNFAGHGMGLSTGKTYADAGAQIGGASQFAQIADQSLANQQAVQQSSLQALASSAGFGNQGGNNTSVNTTPPVSTG
jgi:hypothetical protein